MSAPVFLTIEQVQALHRIALERHGGQDGVRDAATVESAVMDPCNVWLYGQGDVFDIAAATPSTWPKPRRFSTATGAQASALRWCSWKATASRRLKPPKRFTPR